MGKRGAEPTDREEESLKSGERPITSEDGEEMEFEDEFEDEYESEDEDETFEAGVDGGPDTEREAEEKRGMWILPEALCGCRYVNPPYEILTISRWHGCGPKRIYTRP